MTQHQKPYPAPAKLHPEAQEEKLPPLSQVKKMVSTMSTTIHQASWASIKHLCEKRTVIESKGKLKVSVIITFHQTEKLARILHTIHSVFQRTPPDLLHEVILVDDHGKRDERKEILSNYISSVFQQKVILRSNWLKSGLIGARLAGTRLAKGDVLVCMDSHMEVQEHWLQPLLHEINKNRKTLAASYLDWMEYDTSVSRWKYKLGASSWKTYFDWAFTFGFQDISYKEKAGRDPTDPIESPVTIGTIFAIDKQFFRDIGEFDEEMVGWGGENLDLPLRVWMFGGRVVNVPCSHAAHYEEIGYRSYRKRWGASIAQNYRRVADVWLDNYAHLVYDYKTSVQDVKPGNLTSRLELKKKRVHDFKWYLEHVFPQLGVPQEHSLAWGGLKNVGRSFCLHCSVPNSPVIMDCVLKRPERTGFFWSKTGELRFPLHSFTATTYTASESALRTDEWITYYNTSLSSRWIHWKDGPLMEMTKRRCLTTFKETFRLKLVKCNFTSIYQQWRFNNYTESYTQLLQQPAPVSDEGDFMKILRDFLQWKTERLWDKIEKFTWPRHPTR